MPPALASLQRVTMASEDMLVTIHENEDGKGVSDASASQQD